MSLLISENHVILEVDQGLNWILETAILKHDIGLTGLGDGGCGVVEELCAAGEAARRQPAGERHRGQHVRLAREETEDESTHTTMDDRRFDRCTGDQIVTDMRLPAYWPLIAKFWVIYFSKILFYRNIYI